jgi:hypothetical protein
MHQLAVQHAPSVGGWMEIWNLTCQVVHNPRRHPGARIVVPTIRSVSPREPACSDGPSLFLHSHFASFFPQTRQNPGSSFSLRGLQRIGHPSSGTRSQRSKVTLTVATDEALRRLDTRTEESWLRWVARPPTGPSSLNTWSSRSARIARTPFVRCLPTWTLPPLTCSDDEGGESLPGCKEAPGVSQVSLVGGECDPIYMYWDHSRKRMVWWRH